MPLLETRSFPLFILLILAIGACGEPPETVEESETAGDTTAGAMPQMGGMPMGEGYVPDSLSRAKLAPLVKGYYAGGEAFFIHTEASDPTIADTLTKMMGPEVVVVPELARTSSNLTAPIYVFANGIEGMGPLGYQPDVFAAVPGQAEYRPLHVIHQVMWNDDATPEELRSAEAVREAQEQGRLAIEETGIVVNAPVLAWPGGHRGTMAGGSMRPSR